MAVAIWRTNKPSCLEEEDATWNPSDEKETASKETTHFSWGDKFGLFGALRLMWTIPQIIRQLVITSTRPPVLLRPFHLDLMDPPVRPSSSSTLPKEETRKVVFIPSGPRHGD